MVFQAVRTRFPLRIVAGMTRMGSFAVTSNNYSFFPITDLSAFAYFLNAGFRRHHGEGIFSEGRQSSKAKISALATVPYPVLNPEVNR
jgi:hypothetical protein